MCGAWWWWWWMGGGAVLPGQRAVYEMGLTGVPVVNVNNNCSTGSTALFVAR
jgi:acetyl-CoA acetyltransferase